MTTKPQKPSEAILKPLGLSLRDEPGDWNVHATALAVRHLIAYLDEALLHPIARVFVPPEASLVARYDLSKPDEREAAADAVSSLVRDGWQVALTQPALPIDTADEALIDAAAAKANAGKQTRPMAVGAHATHWDLGKTAGQIDLERAEARIQQLEAERVATAEKDGATLRHLLDQRDEALAKLRTSEAGNASLSAQLDMWQDSCRKLEARCKELEGEVTQLLKRSCPCNHGYDPSQPHERACPVLLLAESERLVSELHDKLGCAQNNCADYADTLSATRRTIAELRAAVSPPPPGDNFEPYRDIGAANIAIRTWRQIHFDDQAKLEELRERLRLRAEQVDQMCRDDIEANAGNNAAHAAEIAELRAELAKREAVVRVARNARWSVPGLDDALSALDQPGQPEPTLPCICVHAPEQHRPDGCEIMGCYCKWNGRLGQVHPEPAERAIVVGSTWCGGDGIFRSVTNVEEGGVAYERDDEPLPSYHFDTEASFRSHNRWVSDPPPDAMAVSESALSGQVTPVIEREDKDV